MEITQINELRRSMAAVGASVKGLGGKVSAATKTTQQAAKAVSAAARVTQAVATLLDFDEISKLKEKTVTTGKSSQSTAKQKAAKTDAVEEKSAAAKWGSDFWTRFGLSVQEQEDSAYAAGGNFITRLGQGIANAFGDVVQWVREHLWSPIQAGWSALGTLSLGLGAKLTTTASALWTSFQTAWQTGGSRVVQIGNGLLNSASTLWQRFTAGWGSRSVGIGNTLVNTASTLWQRFSALWGVRSVSVVNTLKNSAATLWEQFKSGWSGRVLGLKISYNTNVGSVKRAVYKALGLSGWPSISFAARGGVFTSATLTMLGEAGTEAVVPLENNTGWMDVMAQKLGERMGFGGSVTVPVYIGGEKVAEQVVRAINAATRRTGVSPLYV